MEKSIASITGHAPADANDIDASNLAQTAPEPELVVKRTVIAQEETESAVNALLGESVESFEENIEPTSTQAVETISDDQMKSCANDEAAAMASLATEMSPDDNADWHSGTTVHPKHRWQEEQQQLKDC